ncbi:MAG TPA: hypothetical protein ENI87_02765 [bacterium]|nr:hypothetical protein [bacterium]
MHLVDGDYQGLLAPAGELLGGRQCNLYATDPISFGVRGASVCDVVVDPPRRLLVRVTDAFTGLPVPSCRIHAGARVDLAPVPGAHRAVWIPQSCTSLQVDAPGYASAVAQVSDEGELDIPMYPGGTGILTIESTAAEELAGARITVRCREPGGHRVSVAVVLRTPGSVPIHIPGARGEVTVDDLEWKGSEWRFDPVQSSWSAGGHIIFRAVVCNGRK